MYRKGLKSQKQIQDNMFLLGYLIQGHAAPKPKQGCADPWLVASVSVKCLKGPFPPAVPLQRFTIASEDLKLITGLDWLMALGSKRGKRLS